MKISHKLTIAALLCATAFAPGVRAEEPQLSISLSISGYDPVAYFTDGKPVQGKAEIEYMWHNLRWRFASEAHRDLFTKAPDHYAPQYDGYCAGGASGMGNAEAEHKDTVDPEAWTIIDGKLYLVHTKYALTVWQQKAAEHIKQADRDWAVVDNLAAPEIVGPPCAASPPTTKVALRAGGHMVAVGGQFALDADGKVIGTDLQQQIEQVGKNVDACLEAGGATVKDIIRTVSFVRDPAEFDKYADLRLRYFGPPSPGSTVVPMPQSTNADLLVQVEARAKIP
jgi:enamine deaminase RidA (YjgF/YER057c/UK114 family)